MVTLSIIPRCLSQKPRSYTRFLPFFPPTTVNQKILSTVFSKEILTLLPFSSSLPSLELRPRQAHEMVRASLPFSLLSLILPLSFVPKISLISAQELTGSTKVKIKYKIQSTVIKKNKKVINSA